MALQAVTPMDSAWARRFAALVGAGVAAYFFLTTGAQEALYDGLAVGSAVVMFGGIFISRPQPQFAWTLVASGVLMLAAGDVVYGVSQPVPSAADMLYVSAYPLLLLGLVSLVPSSGPGRRRSVLIDSSLIAAGIGIVTAALMLVPASQAGSDGMISVAVSLAYPVMDLGLLAVLIRVAHGDPDRRVAWWLLGAGIVFRLIADTGYAFLDFGSSYGLGNPLDVGWLLSYACCALGFLQPALAPSHLGRLAGRAPAPSAARRTIPAARTGRPTRTPFQTRALRLKVVLKIAARMLLGLGVLALGLAATWRTPDLVLVAGAYAGMGSVILLASFATR